jgi:hypothetical protein
MGRLIIDAILRVQKIGRGYISRREAEMSHRVSTQLVDEAFSFARQARHRHASAIQAFMRAYSSWARRESIHDAAVREELLIQRRARREIQEDAAAAKIQSLARMRQAKSISELLRADLARTQASVLRSIVTIQCFFRKTLAKQKLRLKKIHAAAERHRRAKWAELSHALFMGSVQELDRLREEEYVDLLQREHVERLWMLQHGQLAPPEEMDWQRTMYDE